MKIQNKKSVKFVIVILLVILMVMSVLQIVLTQAAFAKIEYKSSLKPSTTNGEIKLYVNPEPTVTGGEVKLNVINKK